jgi:Uma2 family endonuclease
MTIERLRNAADYEIYIAQLALDERTPELINGRFVMAARPSLRRVRYMRRLTRAIEDYSEAHSMVGEVLPAFEVVIDEHTILIPNIAYTFANSALGRLTDARLYGAPEFVCEIASPSTRAYDAHEKYLAYLRAGVLEYWLVDPDGAPGQRFTMFERIVQGTASTMPAFQAIAGPPTASRTFPGLVIDPKLL